MAHPPSPYDVLSALMDFDPRAHAYVLSAQKGGLPNRIRRAAMAAARALGNSYPNIGRAFQRDHTTVLNACRRYCDAQVDSVNTAQMEADLFRVLIAGANRRAQERKRSGGCLGMPKTPSKQNENTLKETGREGASNTDPALTETSFKGAT